MAQATANGDLHKTPTQNLSAPPVAWWENELIGLIIFFVVALALTPLGWSWVNQPVEKTLHANEIFVLSDQDVLNIQATNPVQFEISSYKEFTLVGAKTYQSVETTIPWVLQSTNRLDFETIALLQRDVDAGRYKVIFTTSDVYFKSLSAEPVQITATRSEYFIGYGNDIPVLFSIVSGFMAAVLFIVIQSRFALPRKKLRQEIAKANQNV
jgi:hypothetical protein